MRWCFHIPYRRKNIAEQRPADHPRHRCPSRQLYERLCPKRGKHSSKPHKCAHQGFAPAKVGRDIGSISPQILSKISHLCPRLEPRRYSAASLAWPSRLFSVMSSFSAASAITVPGGKIASAPAFGQRVVVLRRHDAADHDHDVAAALLLQLGLELRHQGQMRRRRATTRRGCARRSRPPGARPRPASRTAGRCRRRSRDRRRPRRSPSGRGRGRPGRSWRPGCAGGGRRSPRRPRPCFCTRATPSVMPTSRLNTPEIDLISARWRPNTFSSAAEISPTVALARAASTASASRLPLPPSAARVSDVERGLAAAPDRARRLQALRACRAASAARRSCRRCAPRSALRSPGGTC